jgi:hypothetical protein
MITTMEHCRLTIVVSMHQLNFQTGNAHLTGIADVVPAIVRPRMQQRQSINRCDSA